MSQSLWRGEVFGAVFTLRLCRDGERRWFCGSVALSEAGVRSVFASVGMEVGTGVPWVVQAGRPVESLPL